MIIDATQFGVERELATIIQPFELGYARRCYGWEYLVLSEDRETTGFPILPLKMTSYYAAPDCARFLVDDAGIIWVEIDGIFVRECKSSALSYVSTYFDVNMSELVNSVSSVQHAKWCLAMGVNDG